MPRICMHLDQGVDWTHAQYFVGVGIEYALVCPECSRTPEAIEAKLKGVSPERFAKIEEVGRWAWGAQAVVGRPEVRERATGLSFEHQEISMPGSVPEDVSDLRPVASSDRAEFLVLTAGGRLLRVDPVRRAVRPLASVPASAMEPASMRTLHVDPGGEMAAVVESRGRYGVVLDLEAGRPTMRLDRGDYIYEHSEFPAAFFVMDGRLRLVHGTDWNRLDVSDPRTGELLTERSPTSYESGEEAPEHYLNYFHGRLAVSPGGGRVADGGWIWHPVGVVTSWSLRRWVRENPWESEDGPSRRELCGREWFWDGPMCWIDDRTLAVWGYGNRDENLIPAALLYDAETGGRLRWFAGPEGSFAFDRLLFSFSLQTGTSAWDVATGERLHHDASLRPAIYHPGARAFITLLPGGGLRLSRLVGHE